MDPLPPQKSLPRIRTFAKDLEAARQKTGQSIPADIPDSPKLVPTPVLGSALSTIKEQAEPHYEAPTIAAAPAFHELKKAALEKKAEPITSQPTVPEAQSRTVRVKVKKPQAKQVAAAKIEKTTIKEGRSAKVGLIRPVLQAASRWFTNLFTRPEKPAVTTSTDVVSQPRKEIQEKALTKSGPSAMSARIPKKEESLQWPTARERAESSHSIDVTWTPNTEPGYPLLEEERTKPPVTNISVEFKKRALPVYIEPITPSISSTWGEGETGSSAPLATPSQEPPSPEIITEQKLTIETQPPIQQTSPHQEVYATNLSQEITSPEEGATDPIEILRQTKESEASETTNESLLTTPEAHSKVRALGNIANLNTNTLSVGIVGVIAVLVLCIILMRALVSFISTDTSQNSTTVPTPITKQATVSDITLPLITREALLTNSTPSGEQILLELRLVNQAGEPIPTPIVLDLFGFGSNRTFIGTVTFAHLATIGNERAIITTVNDPTAAFGSLLGWEDSMPSELSLTLGIPLASPTGDGFKDQTIGSSDVRIYSVDSKQVLVYGFIDRNTVVFANNVATFSAIVSAVE